MLCDRPICGAHSCGLDRLDNVEFDALPHHASPLPPSARHWLFGVETGFVVTAIVLATLLMSRNTGLTRHNTGLPRRRSPSAEEVVPLAYWPGKRPRRPCTETVVMHVGTRRLTRATARMMCDPHVQLLAPLVFYTGASLGFVLNDFTVVGLISNSLIRFIYKVV